MDLQMVEAKNPVLGQDFLTWLWFRSEKNGGAFTSREGQHFLLYVEQRVSVQGGEGEALETAVVSGPGSDFREAKLGLRVGKRVNRALIRIESGPETWQSQLKAEDFTLGSLKTPKTETQVEEGDDPDALFLEKVYLLEKFLGFMDGVYEEFLKLRLSPAWRGEVEDFRRWVERKD